MGTTKKSSQTETMSNLRKGLAALRSSSRGILRGAHMTTPEPSINSRQPEPDNTTCSKNIQSHVDEAYNLLYDAHKQGKRIPLDVAAVITKAHKEVKAGSVIDKDLETGFWNAYFILKENPAESAKQFLRLVYIAAFVIVLFLLLTIQFQFIAGDHIRSKLASLKQGVETAEKLSASASTGQSATSEFPDNKLKLKLASLKQDVETAEKLSASASTGQSATSEFPDNPERIAYHTLAAEIITTIECPFHLSSCLGLSGSSDLPSKFNRSEGPVQQIMRSSRLELLLIYQSAYVLPMLYGLLGACAFVIRKLYNENEKFMYSNNARVSYSLRLCVGSLCGLAVGWFIKPGAGDPSLVSLSPLALAFIAGYGSELFFAALDNFVYKFASTDGQTDRRAKERQ